MEWNRENITLLIEHFREKRELWDPADINFKDRTKRHAAYKALADKLNTEKSVVEKKMRSLIGQFQREYKKDISATGSDETTSKWFGFKLMLFLKDSCKARYTNDTDILEDNMLEVSLSEQNSQSCAGEAQFKRRKRRKSFDSFDPPEETNGTITKHSVPSRDEFAIFGEHIACRLRNLRDPYIVSSVQNQIHNIVFQAEASVYRKGKGTSSKNSRGYHTSTSQNSSSGPTGFHYVDTDTSQFSDDSDVHEIKYKINDV